jgi:hypothetical protein
MRWHTWRRLEAEYDNYAAVGMSKIMRTLSRR